jgi:hypothetical protein
MRLPFLKKVFVRTVMQEAWRKRGSRGPGSPFDGYFVRIHPSDFSLLPRPSQVLLVETQ